MAKILIVDDSPTIALMLHRFLSRVGHEVLVAADGEAGLGMAREQRPDLVVLDNVLPQMNGYEVCRLLKSDEEFRQIKVMLLTGTRDDKQRELGQQVGADLYLTKDAGLAQIIEAAGELLENGTAG